MKIMNFLTMKQEEESKRNERRGKVKAAASFYLGRRDVGQIRSEVRKGALNKLKFNYLVTLLSGIFPQP